MWSLSCASFKWTFVVAVLLCGTSLPGCTADVTLHASPSTLLKSGNNVTVQWSGLTSPREGDWLGIYSPPTSEDQHWVGFFMLSRCATWQFGYGSLQFPLTNLRATYEFRLFHAEPRKLDLNFQPGDRHVQDLSDDFGYILPSVTEKLAGGVYVNFSNWNEPTQVHLALTQSAGEMRVMFTTKDYISSYVRYGKDKKQLKVLRAEEDQSTYLREQLCDEPANTVEGWRDPGIIHDAVMGPLEPATRYFYMVGSDEGGWSETFTFVSAAVSSPSGPGAETNAIVYGDIGLWAPYETFRPSALKAESTRTLAGIQREIASWQEKPGFVSLIGDLCYCRGYAWLWDEFLSQLQPIAASVPFHVAIGNHEHTWPGQPWHPHFGLTPNNTHHDGGGECGVPYSSRFHMPSRASAPTGHPLAPRTRNVWHSSDVGPVHFLHISTEHDMLRGSEQFAFIQSDLASVDHSRTPFIVVMGHRPLLNPPPIHQESELVSRVTIELEPLFLEHRVSLAIWAHIHGYIRTCNARNGTCTAGEAGGTGAGATQGVTHVVCGMGGQDYQPTWPTVPRDPRAKPLPVPEIPDTLRFRSLEFGFCKVHATPDLLTLSFVTNHDGQVHDQLRIPAQGHVLTEAPSSVPRPRQLSTVLVSILSLLAGVLLSTGALVVWLYYTDGQALATGQQWQRVGTGSAHDTAGNAMPGSPLDDAYA